MTRLALIRHGQSQWNLENRFTGWVDVDLTEKGIAEAKKAGDLLRDTGAEFSACYTSVQKRAIRTLWIALDEMDRMWLPVTRAWQLNERHYGGLTGLNKAETAEKHGEDQVKIWRRSYDVPPPPMEPGSEFDLSNDPRYKLYGCDVPATESLKLTLERVQPYYEKEIAPHLKAGDSLIIAAHGNSLRALVKILFNVADEDIVHVEIPTGNPLLIDLDKGLKPTQARYLDEDRAQPIPAVS
ncbi:2,3-diphosphoglycerate-dependent phosphoglycerate mutase [Hyphococcus luteus]|uniref:2,3-bisphosphoglycerate-dependent phosphoglycerate mutase n=1 Tax=Hyphococcus luteus TaxID=2058213 RepID=A0A2S7K7Y0_9PROT|nr:2,3-diphosphoglycerate-dependent phosphoglycerate mutase [Marinicaulis flavus]PQA88614.1 2,3-diphosphoglycerate-dependent phosphoglycerate mutase [Marinicaulis flavus]